jgi:hypothetical protein
MAYTNEGILGDFSGKLSHFIVYKAYGKTIIRSRPAGRSGKPSPKLKAAQTVFARVMEVMRPMKWFVRAGFYDVAQGRSAFHQALSENLLRYRAAENPADLRWLLLSRGTRAGAQDVACSIGEKYVEISWGAPEEGKPWADDDQAMVVATNNTTMLMAGSLSAGRRSQGHARVRRPPTEAGEEVRVYLAFRCALPTPGGKDIENVSESVVVG